MKTLFLIILITITNSSITQIPEFNWVAPSGGSFDQIGWGVTSDAEGNVYSTGSFSDTADFDPGPGEYMLASQGAYDIFLQKLDAEGNFVWAHSTGNNYTEECGSDMDYASAIVTDGNNDIIVGGTFTGNTDFDFGDEEFILYSGTYGEDPFIWKLNTDGELLWVKRLVMEGSGHLESLMTDADNNIYISGSFQTSIDLDPGPGVYEVVSATEFTSDGFVVKLNSEGEFIWGNRIGNEMSNNLSHLAIDVDENVYLAGYFKEDIDCDPGPDEVILSPIFTYIQAYYIVKLNPSGEFLWGNQIHAEVGSTLDIYDIAVNSYGDLVLVGYFGSIVDFDPGPVNHLMTSTGSYDAFILRLDTDGQFINAVSYGGDGLDLAKSVFIDDANDIYITGSIVGSADLDPGDGELIVSPPSGYGMYVCKYDEELNLKYGVVTNGDQPSDPRDIYVDGSSAYITGAYAGSVDFDYSEEEAVHSSAHVKDHFVLKMGSGAISGIHKPRGLEGFKIHPNPNSGGMTIDIGEENVNFIRVYNMIGDLVDLIPNTQSGKLNLNLYGPAGIYIVEIETDYGTYQEKIIKQ